MFKDQLQLISRLSRYLDTLILVLSFFGAYFFAGEVFGRGYKNILNYMWVLLFAIPVWSFLIKKYKLNTHFNNLSFFEIVTRLINVHFFGGIVVSAIILFIDRDHYSRLLFLTFILFSFLFLTLWKLVLKRYKGFFLAGRDLKNLLVVGCGEKALNFTCQLGNNENSQYRILGFLRVPHSESCHDIPPEKIFGTLEDILFICKEKAVDEVVFCLPESNNSNIDPFFRELEEIGVTVRVVLDFYDYESRTAKRELEFLDNGLPILTFHTRTLDAQELFAKRVLDVGGSLVGLFFTLILFPFIYLAIKKESCGPVYFLQDRMGENGRVFKLVKFRTMYVDAEERKSELADQNEMSGAIFKIANDPRVTRIGKFLRRTSLDELPQFWNVLKGEMSLVGTRPPTLDEVSQYKNWHRRRISIKPGLTGLWQVSGRNEIKDFDQIVRLDLQYIDNWDFWLDIKILLKTIGVVLSRHGSC